MTVWHITFGTYGKRLHGDDQPTVDRDHNRFGTPFLPPDPQREARERARMIAPPVEFTKEQQAFIESAVPGACARGGWRFLTCAAGPDHVHVLLDADPRLHGKRIRPWLKRWITEALNSRWSAPRRPDGMSWWSECGSTKAVKDDEYLRNATGYIDGQRATPGRGAPSDSAGAGRPGSLPV